MEYPDFDQIAHAIVMSVPGPGFMGAPFILHRTHIAEQLRLIWNARGAADIAKLGELYEGRLSMMLLTSALRTLDR